MTLEQINAVKTGIYRIYWSSGGSSLASVYVSREGDVMIAPINWVYPGKIVKHATDIASMEKIEPPVVFEEEKKTTLKDELDEVQRLVNQVNAGNAAFWTLVKQYPDVVRTKLGKDVSLKYLTCDASIRQALGNDLEIAIGEKKP